MLKSNILSVAASCQYKQFTESTSCCRLATHAMQENFRPFQPAEGLGPGKGMVVEMVLMFTVIFVALSTTDATWREVQLPSLPSAFAVGTGIMAAVSR